MEHKKIGAGVILIDSETGDLLLGKRSFQSPSTNTFSPFGGTYEMAKDSSPQATAKREFSEETHYGSNYEISSEPFYVQNSPNLKFYSFLGVTNGKAPVTIDKEHLAYGWYPLTHLPSNLHPGFKELIDRKGGILQKVIEKIINQSEEQVN